MGRATYRNKITSDELIEKINPKNKKLVDRFIKNFNTKRSDSSVNIYRSNFNIFFCWNLTYNFNKPFYDIRKSEFMDFFDFAVDEMKWSPNRYANMWSSLNTLSVFIENILDDEYPDFKNNIKKIEKLPKTTVREKTILTDAQIQSLLSHLIEFDEYQQAFFVALAAYSGARVSELFRFNTKNLNIMNVVYDGLFIETTEEIKTKGKGKQGKLIYKYILKAPFERYYNLWIIEREKIMLKNRKKHSHLFIDKDGSELNKDSIRGWIREWEKYLTNDRKTNPELEQVNLYAHAFRHYLCTYLAKIGLEQELIVELYGWASSEMFKIYNDMTAKDREWKSLEKLKTAVENNDMEK